MMGHQAGEKETPNKKLKPTRFGYAPEVGLALRQASILDTKCNTSLGFILVLAYTAQI